MVLLYFIKTFQKEAKITKKKRIEAFLSLKTRSFGKIRQKKTLTHCES